VQGANRLNGIGQVLWRAFSTLWLMSLFACGSEPLNSMRRSDPPVSETQPASGFKGVVRWSPCTSDPTDVAECAQLMAPYHWQNPGAQPTLQIAAKRIRATNPSGRMLWLLAGGPGISGTLSFDLLMRQLSTLLPGTDVYTVDARGSGSSQYLSCPTEEDTSSPGGSDITPAEVSNCVLSIERVWGDDLSGFSLTESTHDVAAFISATRTSEEVSLWGQSSGTVWAQQVAERYPELIQRMILEAIVPGGFSAKVEDQAAEAAFDRVLALCGSSVACSARVPDPRALAARVWQGLDSGRCAAFKYDTLSVQIAIYKMLALYPLYAGIPALLSHIDRCGTKDVETATAFMELVADGASTPYFSQVTFDLVTASELWHSDEFDSEAAYREYLATLYQSSLLGAGSGGDSFSRVEELWPVYDSELMPLRGAFEIPTLALHGGLDPRIPNAEADRAEGAYTNPLSWIANFPYASHLLIGVTPTSDGSGDCAFHLMHDFVMGSPLSNCIDSSAPPNFVGTDWAPTLFGTNNYWDN